MHETDSRALLRRAELERRLRRATMPAPRAPRPQRPPGPLALTMEQEGLWLLHQLEPGNPLYNFPDLVHFAEPVDGDLVREILADIVRRHEVFRTRMVFEQDRPMQVIEDTAAIPLEVFDLRSLAPPERRVRQGEVLAAAYARPFDLAVAPLAAATLVHLSDSEHLLLVNMHHIITDRWSCGVLNREIRTLLRDFRAGRPSSLPELPMQFADWVLAQRRQLEDGRAEPHLAYWRRQLAGVPQMLDLPVDRPFPPIQSFAGATERLRLPDELCEMVHAVARREGVTSYVVLLAVFQILLSRYCGQPDLIVGGTVEMRTRTEIEPLIGFFVNVLALRADLREDPTVESFLRRVRRTTLEAFEHQSIPLPLLVQELGVQRDPGRHPLFQTQFAYAPHPHEEDVPEEDGTVDRVTLANAKFDLTLLVQEIKGRFLLMFEYRTDIFDAQSIRRMRRHWVHLLEQVARHPTRRVSELELLTPAEREEVLRARNRTEVPAPLECVHEMISAQAARTSAALAVEGPEGTLTYHELDVRSDLLAHRLRKLGAGPEVRVGISLPREPELLVTLLAVLKTGGCYVPLDPSNPPERLAWIRADSGIRIEVTGSAAPTPATGASPRVLSLHGERAWIDAAPADVPLPSTASLDNLAYVLYTSGSTGRPKGVAVTHRGLANYARWAAEEYGMDQGSGAPVHTSFGFDLAVTTLLVPLTRGQRVVLAAEATGPEALAELLRTRSGLTPVKLTPSHLSLLTEALPVSEGVEPARVFVVGGEALDAGVAAAWLRRSPETTIVNEYGPTETVVGCCTHRVEEGTAYGASIPIGRPIANTRAYVLDPALRPVPPGVRGELYVGGAGVARGYLGRPAETAARFLPDAWSPEPGARIYRTGDLSRWLNSGELEFLGRADQQVKLRGYRVELGEVEATLRRHPGVQEAAAALRHDGGTSRLVGYVVPHAGTAFDPEVLRTALGRELPDYMVPTAFVVLDAIPLAPSGKVDRDRLPIPGRESATVHVAPRTPAEQALCGIWEAVLGLERVGIHDNFFSRGGDSLSSIRMVLRVREQLGFELSAMDVFRHPVLMELARHLQETETARLMRLLDEIEALPDGNGPGSPAAPAPEP